MMRIRPGELADLERLIDLDGTVESEQYLHVERAGEGVAVGWRLEERALRDKLVDPNPLDEDRRFAVRQVLSGVEEGIVRAVEHDDHLTGLAAARLDAGRRTLDLIDLRVDYEFRRQGLGSALLFQLIAHARDAGVRAVTATTVTNNLPAAKFMAKAAFEMTGLDTHWRSNHDLVKEAVSIFWYVALE